MASLFRSPALSRLWRSAVTYSWQDGSATLREAWTRLCCSPAPPSPPAQAYCRCRPPMNWTMRGSKRFVFCCRVSSWLNQRRFFCFLFFIASLRGAKDVAALCCLSFAVFFCFDTLSLLSGFCFFAWLVRNWTKLPFGGFRSVFMYPCRTLPRERPSFPSFSVSTRPTLRGEALVALAK